MTIRCKGCGTTFASDTHGESPEFDHHDCYATLEPIKGESWEDYEARCKARETEPCKECGLSLSGCRTSLTGCFRRKALNHLAQLVADAERLWREEHEGEEPTAGSKTFKLWQDVDELIDHLGREVDR